MSGRVAALDSIGLPATARGVGTLDRAVLAVPAVLAAATLFMSRLAINARAGGPIDLVAVQELLVPLTGLACAGSLGAIAVCQGNDSETVGLAFVGVFGVAGTIARPAYVPAVVAIIAGTALATGGRLFEDTPIRIGPVVVVGLLVGGLAGSLAGTLGFESAATRSLGTRLTLLGVAGTPVFLARDRADYLVGAVGAGLLVALGIGAPFLLGATGLVAGGIVGASLPLMAIAVGGVTTTASAAVRTRQHAAALGAGLLLFAGIPATLTRALALVLAITCLLGQSQGGEAGA
jgi:hypothetical protein